MEQKYLTNEKRYVLLDIVSTPILESEIAPERSWTLKSAPYKNGPIVYWMNRDKRTSDNWALLFAQQQALEKKCPLIVVFHFEQSYTRRRFDFLVKGLKGVESSLKLKNIPFLICTDIESVLMENNSGMLITDFDPLRESRKLTQRITQNFNIPIYQVDAHNICPIVATSDKREYAARTIRPKIKRIISKFLTEFPELKTMPETTLPATNWDVLKKIMVDDKVIASSKFQGGEAAAKTELKNFIQTKLDLYDEQRNNPTIDAQSNLSPYITFGFISAQRIALEVIKSSASKENKEAFLEELIIRKELSDNFCHYNPSYDDIKSFDNWAKLTLQAHQDDYRAYIYTLDELEQAKTHDELWNAAQRQMVKKAKMHGYMRMYWAKKILEWTPHPELALEYANHLNNKYELDGCCPNGYVGTAWSIAGVHDRAWFERDIFGKIRYMSYQGCKGKFDITKYIEQNS